MAEQLLLPCSIVRRRFKPLQRFLVACVALANVLLLSWAINLRQRVCDVRDWEFASSLFDSTKLVSRGPLLLHSANGSCTIAWESFSPTSLHFIQPSQPFASHSSASSLWFPHYIGLVQAPFGCAWNVYRLQLPACPHHVVFRICAASAQCIGFSFSVLQQQLPPSGARVFIVGDSQRGQTIFEQHLAAAAGMQRPPQLLLHLGDTAQRPNIDGDWDQRFFGPLKRSRLLLPLLLVQGNHDSFTEANASAAAGIGATVQAGSAEHVMVNPSLLSYQGTGAWLSTYFATTVAGVRWIVLDTNMRDVQQLQVSPPLPPAPRNALTRTLQWLRNELQSAAAAAANFRVVCMHIPPWIEFWDFESWGDCAPEGSCDKAYPLYVRTHILPIIVGGGVDVVMSGHQHNYQRGLYGGVVFVTSGGGGGGLDLNRVDNHSVYTVTRTRHHHLLLHISGSSLAFTVVQLDGSTLDQFEVQRRQVA